MGSLWWQRWKKEHMLLRDSSKTHSSTSSHRFDGWNHQSCMFPTFSSWLWTCWTIRSRATKFSPPARPKNKGLHLRHGGWERIPSYTSTAHSPLGTTMSADCTVGSMYCSNAGFTNLLYCLMMPLMFRPRWEMSLLSRRIRRMSESVSTNTFMSSSWQTGRGMFHQGNVSRMLHGS